MSTITYTRTNLSNTTFSTGGAAETHTTTIANFTKAGDTSTTIDVVTSATIKASFTMSNSSSTARTVRIHFVINTSAGKATSETKTYTINNTVTTNTMSIPMTAAQAKSITSVQAVCESYNSSCDLYYRANSSNPWVLTINFQSPRTIKRYNSSSQWEQVYVKYFNGTDWRTSTVKYYNGSEWRTCTGA